jgi:hypothetical protein
MRSRLHACIEALEQALLPKGKLFVMAWHEGDEPSLAESEAAFRAENGVGPHDDLIVMRPPRRPPLLRLSNVHVAIELEATASDGLVARFSPDIALPDLLVALSTCERRGDFSMALRRAVYRPDVENRRGPMIGGRSEWAHEGRA